jgi:hypothetical protein
MANLAIIVSNDRPIHEETYPRTWPPKSSPGWAPARPGYRIGNLFLCGPSKWAQLPLKLGLRRIVRPESSAHEVVATPREI